MNERRQQGGGGRQARRQTPVEQQTQNQQISAQATVQDILRDIVGRRKYIEPLLPVPWERFITALTFLLRTNPGILKCTPESIINCAYRAAYDGVNLDGNEAAAIPSNNSYKDDRGQWYKLLEARYNIMVAGVRKQIMRTGSFKMVETILVYEKDEFSTWVENDKRHLTHRQSMMAKDRGALIGCYSMATYVAGGVSYEIMNEDQILAVKASAKTGDVWDGKMFEEMWRKTVLRRHRKTLLGDTALPDSEEIDLFPDLARRPDVAAALAPNRPKRSDYQALPDQSGSEAGVDMGFGFQDDRLGMAMRTEVSEEEMRQSQEIEQQRQQRREGKVDEKPAAQQAEGQQQRKAAENGESRVEQKPREQQARSTPAANAPLRLPNGPDEWKEWEDAVADTIRLAQDADALTAYWQRHSHIVDEADPGIANFLNDAMADKLSELALNPPVGDPGASQGQHNASGGEQ